ncbi:MAG: AarF/ABC1/UbiB kinase family protein [Alphaproteobacteria bacterium]|nr:AarF/ABC1/UbiB kinase family protein [Alphaproteobacteria bacterium]
MKSNAPTISRAMKVPSGRFVRLARIGSMATGIAGNMALNAVGDISRGARPELRNLLVTPNNLRRMADELARMRGAAMKIGQLMSMDAGDVLPPELAEILARLRNDAHFMPARQLKRVLNANWGETWLREFESFDVRPIAAASIGQVRKATLRDGREVAVKVQYPGVARSIDSDVANVGALVRLSGLLPKGFELAPYLEEARRQLHEETDYLREGRHLQAFKDRLAGDGLFDVPLFHADWSTREVLTMSFMDGRPIEEAAQLSPQIRDRIAARLIDLFLRELFEFAEMQSDPNFANYRFNPATGRIVLLDFGATRRIDPDLIRLYRRLMVAGLAADREGIQAAASKIGFLSPDGKPDHQARILTMIETVFAALKAAPVYDFSDAGLFRAMQKQGMALAEAGYVPPPLPMDVLYLQRKVGGLFLLASKLRAKVPIEEMLQAALAGLDCDALSDPLDAG